jgi:RNA polymerase-binding transcription factor
MIRKHRVVTRPISGVGENSPLAVQTEATPAERAKIARALLSVLREQEITRLKLLVRREISREASAPGDDSDSALQQEGIELQASLMDLSESRLEAIWAAFDRLQESRYGVCAECGDEMPFERLRAMPMALRCVDCQASFETARIPRAVGRNSCREPAAREPVASEAVRTEPEEPERHLPRRRRGAR